MANMSYCRMRNTLPDLRDAYDNMDEALERDAEDAEYKAALKIIRLAREIVDSYGHLVDEE